MKICFWGNISAALDGRTIGGGELQVSLLAKALAKAGHEVVVVDPYNGKTFITEDGVRVLPVPEWNRGLRVVRMFSHNIPALYRMFKLQNAEIYYVRMRGFYNLLPYLAARSLSVKFVLAVASDLDVASLPERVKNHYLKSMSPYDWIANAFPTEAVFPYLLRHADVVLTQHETQKMELQRKHIHASIFRNLIDIQAMLTNINVEEKRGYVYVGSLDVRKGFDKFVSIANQVTNKLFTVIGQPRGIGAESLLKRLQQLPNVKIFGRLSHEQTVNQIANSEALICTSPVEGFPNTFLEAWCSGVPVISLSVDPGGVIEREGLGVFCHGDLKKLIKTVEDGFPHWDAEHLRRYVRLNHSIDGAAERFLSILRDSGMNQA